MMQQKELRYYIDAKSKAPFFEGLNSINDHTTKARIKQWVNRLVLGLYGDCKSISKNLWELRLDFGSGYRIYFTEQGDEIILLLCGGNKSTQQRDIERAKSYMEALKGT